MGRVVPISKGVVYVGEEIEIVLQEKIVASEKRKNLQGLKSIIDRLKLPDSEKKSIINKIKKEQ